MKYLLILLMIVSTSLFSQKLKFYGDIKQASLVKAEGNDIDSAWLNNKILKVNDKKNFIFGFDRDDSATFELKVKYLNGDFIVQELRPKKRKYNIQRINNMKPSLVSHPDIENDRVIRERKISQEARIKVGENIIPMYKVGFVRPIKGGRISGRFGNQRILNGETKNFHNGVDIAVPAGTPVFAMSDGVVLLSADTFYYAGNNVLIDHGDGLNSFYLHMKKKYVKVGNRVKAGDIIGEVGSTGRSTGPHLHWGVQWFGKRLDPLDIIKNNISPKNIYSKKKKN